MKNMAFCVLLVIAAALPSQAAEAPDQKPFEWKVGAASACITPENPLRMAGYGARKDPAEGTEQDLFAKSLAIPPHALLMNASLAGHGRRGGP